MRRGEEEPGPRPGPGDRSAAGSESKPLTGTRAWLIKQSSPQSEAQLELVHSVCQSVPGWLEGTLWSTKGERNVTMFFKVGMC